MTPAVPLSCLVATLTALACSGGRPRASTPSPPSLPSLDCPSLMPWETGASDEPPGMVNWEALSDSVAGALADSDPAPNAAMVTLRVTRRGTVDRACLGTSSGVASFDSAAVRAAYRLRFEPATRGGRPVRVTVSIPFPPVAGQAVEPGPAPPEPPPGEGGAPRGPSSVAGVPTLACRELATWDAEGSQTPPRPLNPDEVRHRLVERLSDPPTGTLRALVTMRVTRTGSVDRACLAESSGYGPFDRAAVETAFFLRFRPGTTDGEPRSVSLSLPFRVAVR